MKKKIRQFLFFLIVFIIIFLITYFLNFNKNYGDPLNNYAFSKSIKDGYIAYLDFNTISTPLYALILSIGLHFNDSFLTFFIEHSILVTVAFCLLYKLFGKKSTLLLLITVIFQCSNIGATYNFMCLFMLILIIYVETQYNNKDYLIGILISLAFLSKQTVGFFFIIPSLVFYHNDLQKLKKRILGFLLPLIIFIIYLFVHKCVYQFFDLCFFGLFDFLNNNGIKNEIQEPAYLVFTFLVLIVFLFLILKDKENMTLYYLICGFFFTVPLFDNMHFSLFFTCLVIALLPYFKINEKLVFYISISTSFIISFFLFLMWPLEVTFTRKIDHFESAILTKDEYKKIQNIHSFFDKYKNDKCIIIACNSMLYRIKSNQKITYFDVPYNGNFGYNGNKKMIDKIKKTHNYYFIVSLDDYKSKYKYSQFSKVIVKYIIDNYNQVDEKYNFAVFYKQ